ncbi:MAG: type II secretion system F family protein [Terriglobia bacterium]|nr:MAG: type II secretion system F family protein [Terriglobia bacterium]
MLFLVTALIFLSITAVTAFVGLRLWNWREQAIDRIAPQKPTVSGFLPSPSLIWRELVDRIGTFAPASPKDLPLLKRRMIRAGFRDPQAVRFFYGTRAVSTVALSAIGIILAFRSGASAENLVLLIAAAVVAGYRAPMQYLLFRIRRRKRSIERGLPNALDLMVVCVESGLGLDQTILQVAKELQFAYPEICDEFALINLEMRAGKRRVEALHNLADRTGVDELKKLVAVLVQTDRFGTSVAQCLRGHSEYMRIMARQRAEERAAKLAVKLVFPIFFCVLPSLFVVTLGPVITRLVRDLLPMIENM